jgi:hypothetical protein
MNNTQNDAPVLTNISIEQIRTVWRNRLLDACNGSPAPVKIGKTEITKRKRAKTLSSKQECMRIIENKFNRKYHHP